MTNQLKMCLIVLLTLLAAACERADFLPTDSLEFRSELINKYEAAGYSDVSVRSYKTKDPESVARMVCVSFVEDNGFLSSTEYTQCHESTASTDNLPATAVETKKTTEATVEAPAEEAKGSQPKPAYRPMYKPLGKYASEFGINL